MGAESDHGRRRRPDVLARRTLNRPLAALLLWSAFFHAGLPAAAAFDEPPGLDPRFAALLASRTCGQATATPAPADASAAEIADTYAAARRLGARRGHLYAALLHDDGPAAAATSAPSGSPNSAQSPGTNAGASPAADASASPSATLLPIPPVPPPGPKVLVVPTPRGSPTATPFPLPSPSPSADSSAPVFLVRPTGSPGPITPRGASPAPSASPTAAGATPAPTLGPYQIVTIADRLEGSSDQRQPSDLIGNVHIFYTEGQIVGDRAHFDGDHTIVVRGHTYLLNRNQDSILYADAISFDTQTRRATLVNGSGESVEGVQRGKLHYTAQQLTARSNGITHGDRASFTTCEHPHAGYHVEARSIDVTPGDKLVARKAVVFLGPTAIFYLPLLVIPLVEQAFDQRRQPSFLPVVGYSQVEGFYIKARLGFAPSNTYYGYYRVEFFSKRGLGLGYVAYIGAKDSHRYTTVDSYTINDRIQNARHTNINVQDTENFSPTLRGQFGINYEGDYGATLSLPATINLTGSLVHQGRISTENLTFARFAQGSLSNNLDFGFVDSINVSQAISQQLNLTYSKFNTPLASNDTFHINTNTHAFTRFADFNLTYDKTDYSANPFGYDRVPELQILPHLAYGSFKFGPQLQFTAGNYTEPQNHFTTSRVQGQLNESIYAKVLGGSDFSANYNLTQDYYGTGDLKAFDQQNASLNTPIGNHLISSLTYNEQHPIGPVDVPFQLFDRLGSGAHSAAETLRFYNKDIYSLSLSDGTSFNRMAQPLSYQLSVRPSPRSYLIFGGFFQPGPGFGFNQTNVQAITPFGRDTTLEFTTNVDWKNHMRLESKNIYLSRVVDNCYNLQLSYNQDLKQFNFNVVILAFPGQGVGFGLSGNGAGSIVPGSLAF